MLYKFSAHEVSRKGEGERESCVHFVSIFDCRISRRFILSVPGMAM